MVTRCKIIYCEGPGDLVASYAAWKRGHDFTKETSVTFSGQFFEFCRLKSLSFYAVSYGSLAQTIVEGTCTVSNLPRREIRLPKIGYELTVFLYAARLLLIALQLRPQVIFVASGVTDWIYLAILRLSGARIVPILHNTLWPEGFPPRQGLRQKAYRFIWQRCVWWTLAVSPACARQVQSIAGPVPITIFKPSFPAASFTEAKPKQFEDTSFRVMFAGRIEENKGVFDILDIAEQLPHVEFLLCGEGNALPELRRQVDARRLTNVSTYGQLERVQLLDRYLQAHVVIVPTKSSFAEGFAMVVAEAILLLRPVISNPVVPATEVLQSAVVLVPTDNVSGYVAAIEDLSKSGSSYHRLVEQAAALRAFILDDSTSFLESLKIIGKRMVDIDLIPAHHEA